MQASAQTPREIDRVIFQQLFSRLLEESEMLLLHGVMPVDLDEAMTAWGLRSGPLEMQDSIGTDVEFQLRKARKAAGEWPQGYMSLISDRMVDEGRLGRQTVVGWYRYPGGKGKIEDPLIEDLVAEESHFARIERKKITPGEVTALLVSALADEAWKILAEHGEVSRELINRVSIDLIGLSPKTGGILELAGDEATEMLLASYRNSMIRFGWLREPVGLLQALENNAND